MVLRAIIIVSVIGLIGCRSNGECYITDGNWREWVKADYDIQMEMGISVEDALSNLANDRGLSIEEVKQICEM